MINILSNEHKKKRRDTMSRREEKHQDLVSIYVDGSNEEQGHHKQVSAFLLQNITTVDLTSTSHYDSISLDNTDDGEKVVTKAPIDIEKHNLVLQYL